jgi:hypothetical protein
MDVRTDEDDIRHVVDRFFGAFSSGPDLDEQMAQLAALFHPRAIIVRTCGLEPEVYDVDGFVQPRHELLAGGHLQDFREWPLEGRVEVFGDVAHWFGSYAKSGTQDGDAFTGRGRKSIQFLRTDDGWRITAAAWDDEREGVPFPNG